MGDADQVYPRPIPCSKLQSMLRAQKLLLCLSAIAASAPPAIAQDPIAAYPKNYSLALDNDVVSVIRVHYGPHERIGVHDHSRFPTVYVYLSPSGPVRFEHDEKPPFRLTRAPTTTGAFRVSPGRMERHAVENLGEVSSDFLRVELKQIPLGGSLQPYRGKAPSGPSQSSQAIEYRSSEFDVQRVPCQPDTRCKLDSSASPSLLIAFSSLQINENDNVESLKNGDIQWVQGSTPASLSATTNAPAHLLRIIFQLPPK
jgi:hypothetical protein